MYLRVCVITVLFTVVFAAEKGSHCITPNGENAKCISIYDCGVIQNAIVYLDQGALEFAKRSQCGYDRVPLVCCGTAGRASTPAPAHAATSKKPIYVVNPESFPDSVDNLFLPDSTLCGLQTSENRKPHAKHAEVDEYPWMAVLKYRKHDGSDEDFLCAGTLISDKYILTAADCLDIPGFDLIAVRLGESDFSTSEECVEIGRELTCSKAIDYAIEKKIPHVYYNNETRNYNIALLRLKKRADYSEFIRALCLPPTENPPPKIRTLMEASGWGITKNGAGSNVKQKRQKLMADCARSRQNATVHRNQACFTNRETTDGCGDLGGPLMRKYLKSDETDEEQYYQEGIILGSCKQNNNSCPYVRVSAYTDWILSKLEY